MKYVLLKYFEENLIDHKSSDFFSFFQIFIKCICLQLL